MGKWGDWLLTAAGAIAVLAAGRAAGEAVRAKEDGEGLDDERLLREWRRAAGMKRQGYGLAIAARLWEAREGEAHPALAAEAERLRREAEQLDDRALAAAWQASPGWERAIVGRVIRDRCGGAPWDHEALIDFARQRGISF